MLFVFGWAGVFTLVHLVKQRCSGRHRIDAQETARHGGSCMLKFFFLLLSAAPMVVVIEIHPSQWRWARPVTSPIVQLVGAFFCLVTVGVFTAVHCAMGDAWSPVPVLKEEQTLVTSGPFRFARHPMYAVFTFYVCLGIPLATLNWLLVLACVPWLALILARIPREEAILGDMFGEEYAAYKNRVGSVGPKWLCFWEKRGEAASSQREPLNRV